MTRKALITGVNGQDGILLSALLVRKGYEVIGLGRQKKPSPSIDAKVRYFQIDICETKKLAEILHLFRPEEIYNLASITSVAQSFDKPELTWKVNSEAVQNLLELISESPMINQIKLYQASSSEMFGLANIEPQDEEVPFHPISPYAQSKVSALNFCRESRSRGIFVASGIMYNHESIYRPHTFVTRKITSSVAAIRNGNIKTFKIGNIFAERDWGYAGDFVEAMWLMLQADKPEDFVISTGVVHSVKEIVALAFAEVGLAGREHEYVEIDENLLRPREVGRLVGNSERIRESLGWEAKKTFEELIREMVRYDLIH